MKASTALGTQKDCVNCRRALRFAPDKEDLPEDALRVHVETIARDFAASLPATRAAGQRHPRRLYRRTSSPEHQ
ncbi:hypothetical protein IHE33_14595 (plasmid) [Mycetohabitans endofungorum]|uniref:hypothetical protein n=1 Tax=Mycetohabitans endofungorum TaxID=417203 RepID=UPI003243936C